MSETMAKTETKTEAPVTIKKYANRRLYNTGTSTYVTLEDLAKMVKSGEDVYKRQGMNCLPVSFSSCPALCRASTSWFCG